jgi:hypothetical protein
MHVHAFNACLLLGWCLLLAGGVMLHPGWGLAVAGVALVALALIAARVAGGLYVPKAED